MQADQLHMERALELAQKGFPNTTPNPLVGAVLVHDGAVIAEGFHSKFGAPHAEVECFLDADKKGISKEVIRESTLYVTLEPCTHDGKTPPCVSEIINRGIQRVIVGTHDTNSLVSGKGIEELRRSGISVTTPALEQFCRKINKRFFTFHEKKRPYVILKWAQTQDGFIADSENNSKWISGDAARSLVHRFRHEESAIMVGTNTAIFDNPFLTARIEEGRNPIRVLVDRKQKIPTSFNVFDEAAPTLLFNEIENYKYGAAELIKIDFSQNVLSQILDELYRRGIQSLLVEGGAVLLNSFIAANLWDEARVFVSKKKFLKGISAPVLVLPKVPQMTFSPEGDQLFVIEAQ